MSIKPISSSSTPAAMAIGEESTLIKDLERLIAGKTQEIESARAKVVELRELLNMAVVKYKKAQDTTQIAIRTFFENVLKLGEASGGHMAFVKKYFSTSSLDKSTDAHAAQAYMLQQRVTDMEKALGLCDQRQITKQQEEQALSEKRNLEERVAKAVEDVGYLSTQLSGYQKHLAELQAK